MNSNNALMLHNMNHTKTVEKSVDFVKEVELEGTVNAVCKPKVFGNSTQENVPAPDNPIDIKSTGDEGSVELNAMGKNLINTNITWRIECAEGITKTLENNILTITAVENNQNYVRVVIGPDNTNRIENNLAEGDTFTIFFKMKGTTVDNKVPNVYFKVGMGGYKNMIGTMQSEYTAIYYTGVWKDATNIDLHLGFRGCIGTVDIDLSKLMICKGELTPYQKYRSNTIQFPLVEPLRKVGDVADYIDWENKKIVRNVDKIVLDENKIWNMGGRQFEQCATFYTDTKGTTFRPQKLCNYFPFIDQAYNNNMDVECITNNVNSSLQMILLQIKKSRLETVDGVGLNNWLKEHNVVIYEELATPIEEPFNQEQLAVAELMTTQKNCAISVITETEPSKVELKYLKMGVK